jgi:hypothetical protein
MIIGTALLTARMAKLVLQPRNAREFDGEPSMRTHKLPSLPDTAVIIILSHLSSVQDICSAEQVSRTWRGASQPNGSSWRAHFYDLPADEREALVRNNDMGGWTWKRKYIAATRDRTRRVLYKKARLFDDDFDALQVMERKLASDSEQGGVNRFNVNPTEIEKFKQIVDKQFEDMTALRRKVAALAAALQVAAA